MKRYIRANNRNLKDVIPVPGKNVRYLYRLEVDDDNLLFSGQLNRISSYDDADYWWAKIEPLGEVKYIKNNKVQKSDTIDYDLLDNHEDFDEFIRDEVDKILRTLDALNQAVKPVMIHN